jgi:hypothetical protein
MFLGLHWKAWLVIGVFAIFWGFDIVDAWRRHK